VGKIFMSCHTHFTTKFPGPEMLSDLLPETIETEEALDEILTRPRPALIEFIKTVQSPLLLLGAGGKMGPTLAVLAQRAAHQAGHMLEVVAASRFSNGSTRNWLEQHDIHTLACDLMDPESWQRLPDADNIIYLLGQKFGTTLNPESTWAINALPPAYACTRYPASRIVVLSSGSIYPFTLVRNGGADESEPLTPLGEYANACIARERIFEYFASKSGMKVVLIRLFYAVELRYGVLVDLAEKVYTGEPIDLAMGYFNWIWQGDANDIILRSLALADTPPAPYNLTGRQTQSVREIASRYGEIFGKRPQFVGNEADTALLGNASRLYALMGKPATPQETIIGWIAGWIQKGGRILGKPTHFEVRDGRY
jgi:nucleoside-diphosphate-sugar epimerase